jgi:Helix-turn-helix domain
MKLRDSRKRGWFWARNEIFDWWGQAIGPMGIAIYLCLCRHANGRGESHPSFARIAAECGMSKRSAIRTMKVLIVNHLIHSEQRISEKGDPDSNTYTILDLPKPQGIEDDPPLNENQGASNSQSLGVVSISHQGSNSQSLGVVSISHPKETNNGKLIEGTTTTPLPPPPITEEPPTAERSGSDNLVYPKELTLGERKEVTRMLEAVNGQAQQLLDELAGQLKAKEIKNPLGYLRGLIAKAKEGKFSATAGIKVGEIRRQRARIEASIKASEERARKPLEEPGREERWRQLEKLRKLKESLGATAHP